MPEVGYELYRVITVSGPDAADFLQGQLTQDVGLLRDSASVPAAWCNARGRVIATMDLVAMGDAIGLIVAESIAPEMRDKLLGFRFRAKVDFAIGAVKDFDDLAGSKWASGENRLLELIQAGIPTIAKENSEKFTPHMLNLDRLGAISFSKGCYTGQEVVARTEHLGASKRRLMRYRTDADSVAVGDKLIDEDRSVGEVVNVAGGDFLAVTPVASQQKTLTVNGDTATPLGLPYS